MTWGREVKQNWLPPLLLCLECVSVWLGGGPHLPHAVNPLQEDGTVFFHPALAVVARLEGVAEPEPFLLHQHLWPGERGRETVGGGCEGGG